MGSWSLIKVTADGIEYSSRTSCRLTDSPRPILWQAASVCAALLLRPFSRWLQCQKEPGSACQTSTQGPLRFLVSLSLDAVMQDSLPEPAFFSLLLLILAAQWRAVFAVMQERASCKCNFVEFCVPLSIWASFAVCFSRTGEVKLKNSGICNFMLTRLDSWAAGFFFFKLRLDLCFPQPFRLKCRLTPKSM